MAAKKKKTKVAANPARGFATTSIASKPKVEKQEDEVDVPDKIKSIEQTLPQTVNPETIVAPTKEVNQTPEELEAQLEQDELQLLVEKHANKTRRESRRQVSKIQTEQRVLRPQAQSMPTYEWLPEELLNSIITLAREESNDSNRRLGQQSFLKVVSEDDALSKLWTLDIILKDLGFSDDQTQPVLKWLCANAPNIDFSASIWGFQESLEWLALDQGDQHSFSYEESVTKAPASQLQDNTRPATPAMPQTIDADTQVPDTSKKANVPEPSTSSMAKVAESDNSDAAISDLDSDLEPDELVPTYLKIKGRIFELDPDVLETKPSKSKASKSRSLEPKPAPRASAAVRKLLSQLQKLESDTLFDHDEAQALWPNKRNQIAQEKAAKWKPESFGASYLSNDPHQDESSSEIRPSVDPPEKAPKIDEELSDDGMLGDMFAAIPDEPLAASAETNESPDRVTLKDFGKQIGLPPRRILEEAVRARDSNAKITYKIISPTTYSCRHSVTISWTKEQQLAYVLDIPAVSCSAQYEQVTYSAITVATVSEQQSESYISTVALFSMFSCSPKEEKIYLRLPTAWRELYKDLLEQQQLRTDAADRLTIKKFRAVIQDQVEQEETDGVVLTSRFKQRNQGNNGTSNVPGSPQKPASEGSDSLRDLWAYKASTPAFQHMLQVRNTLPVLQYRQSILSTIDKHQVTIICGETGCGKSTQIPSFILEHELSKGVPCKIFCTEPRRISAISLAQRVSEELGEGPNALGTARSLVGYAIRLESKTSQQTRLIYATVGVVLRMLESSQRLEKVTHLIIDEVHERSIDTDFLLIILRSLMLVRPELKVVLMSATVDAQRFAAYLDNAPILNIPGRTFPVQTRYLEDAIELTHYKYSGDKRDDSATSEDEEEDRKATSTALDLTGYAKSTRDTLKSYDEYAIDYDLIVSLIETIMYDTNLVAYANAFLVFLPGIAEIRKLNDLLLGHPTFQTNCFIYPLHSTISSEDQQAAFRIPPIGVRKIVLATNIAETGVTIPDITCVIDTGKHKEMRFDERRQLSRLTQSFISRANAKQRRGRAGRVQEGLCFHLFTKYRHDNLMTDQQTPEMLRLSLQDLVMRTKICKLGDIEKTLSEALDPPSSRNIRRAIDALIEVDALTTAEELTPLGRQLAKLPLDAHLGKLVLLATVFKTLDPALTIAALLSSKSPFITPFGARQRADLARLSFKKGDSDLLTAYNAYNAWKTVCNTPGISETHFCQKNFLSSPNLSNIEDLKSQLLSSLVDAGFVTLDADSRKALSRMRNSSRHRTFVLVPAPYDLHSNNDTLVTSVIAAAFYPKILTRDGKGWRNIANNQSVSLAPTSVNKGTKVASFLSYYNIMQSSSRFLNAHSTSIAHPMGMCLTIGAEVEVKLHAGVIGVPGMSGLKFAVKDWRVAVAIKVLRRRIREIMGGIWKNPGRGLSLREMEWMGLFFKVFEEKESRTERIREGAVGKGK